MYSGRNDFFDAMNKLAGETQQLVEEHWQAIETLAQALLKKEWKSQAPPSGERRWSTQLAEKKLDSFEIIAVLQQFLISRFRPTVTDVKGWVDLISKLVPVGVITTIGRYFVRWFQTERRKKRMREQLYREISNNYQNLVVCIASVTSLSTIKR
jgi:hypothetical protein